MFVVRELLVSLDLLNPLLPMILTSEALFRFLYSIELSVVSTSHFVNFTETAFAELPNRLEALLEVGIVLGLVVEAAGQRIDARGVA